MVLLNPPTQSRSTSEMTLSLSLQHRISFAFSSKLFCRSQRKVSRVLMNPLQNSLCLLKNFNGPYVHFCCFTEAYMFAFFKMFKRHLNFMQLRSTVNFVQFPSKQTLFSHLPVKLQWQFIIPYKSKRCMNI